MCLKIGFQYATKKIDIYYPKAINEILVYEGARNNIIHFVISFKPLLNSTRLK
jgi:hypothetical protein